MYESARHASPSGRHFLQAKQFAAKCAVNIYSAQENDFNCIIKLVVNAASGQNDWGEAGTTVWPSEGLTVCKDFAVAPSFFPTVGVLRMVREEGGRGLARWLWRGEGQEKFPIQRTNH